jgi:hypothetical protein
MEVDGDLRLLPEDHEAFLKFQTPRRPQYSVVSSLDGIALLPGDLKGQGSGHAIFDRGRLIGRWEFDTETGTIAWASSEPRDKALEKAVKEMEAFVREDLGDARSFSLDSPKSRAPRIEALRGAGLRPAAGLPASAIIMHQKPGSSSRNSRP